MLEKNNCNDTSQFLGYVSAKVVSASAPSRTDVIWFKPINNNTYDILYWNGTAWVSFLSAPGTTTYQSGLDELIEMLLDVGGIPEGTSVADLNGESFSSLFDQLLFPIVNPEYESPTALLQGSDPKLIKVATAADLILNASFDQANAGDITLFELSKDAAVISNSDSFTDTGAVLNAPGLIVYEGDYQYADGPVLDNSRGTPFPTGQILAGNIETNQVVYEWIYPWFWGVTNDIVTIDIPGGNEVLEKIAEDLAITFGSSSSEYLWFAVPSSEPSFLTWLVTLINQGSIGSPSDLFAAPVIESIASGNFSGIDYDLYVSNYPTEVVIQMIISQ